MPSHFRSILILIVWVTTGTPILLLAAEDSADTFRRQVFPLLSSKCFTCHGPDEETREAGLRLDSREGAIAELDSGSFAVVPENAEESELLRRVTTEDEGMRMPPPEAGASLTVQEIDILRSWIEAGAPWQTHWAFDAVRQPALPELDDDDWSRQPWDRFVLARLRDEGLSPSPEADRYTLIRRASLDLTGLPPTWDDVEAFIQDARPDAYERLVDRLLNSPAYGERFARPWLDLARYADSAGYANDPPRTIWRYRDWVIEALNANLPYDQFTIEQLAGDLLPDATLENRLATAFHRNTLTNSEGGTDDEEFRVAAVVDRVNTTMQVWMGITMGCAQCHTHKYDPITQAEYYQMFAFFNQTADNDQPNESPTLETPTWLARLEHEPLRRELEQLRRDVASAPSEHAEENADKENPGEEPALSPLQERLQQLEEAWEALEIPTTPIMRELSADQCRTTRIMHRGNFLDLGEEVEEGVPAVFHRFPDQQPRNRLGLAHWLMDERNPLTARVAVNRLWETLFGTGLVETSEDFGVQGTPPTHPELLDWLAADFMRHGWDMKRLLRTLVTSAAYRQSSRATPELLARDPSNRLYARGPWTRLEAEAVRDQALAVSGLLSRKLHGPPARPPRPVLGLRAAFGASTDWQTSPGEDRYRRGLYTFWQRTTPYPSMSTFDAPSREVCTIRRIPTNTPLQALVTLNDEVYVEAAQALARRVLARHPDNPAAGVYFTVKTVLCRPPTSAEQARLVALYESAHEKMALEPENALALATEPLGPLPPEADSAAAAAWTVVGNVLLNLDEILTKR